LSQLSPIMEQLAGVDLQRFLQDISRLPGAVTDGSRTEKPQTAEKPPGRRKAEPPGVG
jgi:hypothetical protein